MNALRFLKLSCLVLAISACTTPVKDPGDKAPGPSGGTSSTGEKEVKKARLTRLRYNGKPAAAGEDPADSLTFHDEKLNVDCYFVAVNDKGDWQCVPKPDQRVYFTDGACTQAVIFHTAECDQEVPTFATANAPSSGDDFLAAWLLRKDLFRVGDAAPQSTSLYQRQFPSGGCALADTMPEGDAFEAIADDGSTLAHAKFEWKKGTSGRLGLPMIVPEDDVAPIVNPFIGSAQDFSLDAGCFLGEDGCRVQTRYVSTGYSDAECNAPVSFLTDKRTHARDSDGVLRKVTTSMPAQVFRKSEENMCSEAAVSRYVVTLGEPLEEAAAQMTVEGSGRIRARIFHADGLSFFSSHVDSENGDAECFNVVAPDGKERCVPMSFSNTVAYKDEQCTQRFLLGDSYSDVPGETYVAIEEEACSARPAIYAIGAEIPDTSAPVYVKTNTGECELFEDDFGGYPNRFEIGAPVDFSLFGEIP
jgi:hypothetical protein